MPRSLKGTTPHPRHASNSRQPTIVLFSDTASVTPYRVLTMLQARVYAHPYAQYILGRRLPLSELDRESGDFVCDEPRTSRVTTVLDHGTSVSHYSPGALATVQCAVQSLQYRDAQSKQPVCVGVYCTAPWHRDTERG